MRSEQVDRFRLKTNMDEINWSYDFYSDMFSLDFDRLFSVVALESLEMKKTVQLVKNQTSHFFVDTINW